MTSGSPQDCDVVGCGRPATGIYVQATDAPVSRKLEFEVCSDHFDRLLTGEQPHVVCERFDLAQLHGRPALIMEPESGESAG